jgi:hypothetical protein
VFFLSFDVCTSDDESKTVQSRIRELVILKNRLEAATLATMVQPYLGKSRGGCTSTDFDFDGVPYQLVWPGTLTDASADQQFHPLSIGFTSPLFTNSATGEQ